MRKHTALVFIAAAISFGSLAVAQQQDTSLGDVVKQHKVTKKAARVITDEDIPSRADNDPSPAVSASATTAVGSDAPEAKAGDSKEAQSGPQPDKSKGDKADKKDSPEVAALKTRLDQLNKDIDNMQFSIKGMQTQLSNENDDERRNILENGINSRTSSLQHAMLEREDVTGKLQDLQKPKAEQ